MIPKGKPITYSSVKLKKKNSIICQLEKLYSAIFALESNFTPENVTTGLFARENIL